MAKTSLAKTEENTAVATVDEALADSQFQGEVTPDKMMVPRLSLLQKSSAMVEDMPGSIGKYVWDELLELGTDLNVIFIRAESHYVEDVPFGETPQRWDKRTDAMASGCDFVDEGNLDLLVEVDPNYAEYAMVEHDGRHFIPARYTVRKGSFKATIGVLIRDRIGWLNQDLASGFYTLGSKKKTFQSNSWFAPSLKANGKVGPELREKIREVLGV